MGQFRIQKTNKTTLLYKILNDHSVPSFKELLIGKNSQQTAYDLRNSQSQEANFPKTVLRTVVLDFGTISRAKLWKLRQIALLKILFYSISIFLEKTTS